VSVHGELASAFDEIARTLLVLDEDGEVSVEANARSAWMNTPWSWRSTGERVTLECEERVVRVDAVVTALEVVVARSHPSGTE